MTCYHPLKAYRSLLPKENGKHLIAFKTPNNPWKFEPLELPCGQCHGCRLERSRQWAIRCYHEASLYPYNCFITLTYNKEHLPADLSLNLRHFQLFIKKLRQSIKPIKVRFFHCGEYGEQKGRPHYHACLFNYDFPDKSLYKIKNKIKYYNSPMLDKLWGKGYCVIGDVTFESAAYVARYIMKKINGEKAEAHYSREGYDLETGEILIYQLQPEYTTMSRRPGIGKRWFDQFKTDVYPGDFVILRGRKMRPPAAYDRLYEISDKEEFEILKMKRIANAEKHVKDQTPERLATREIVQKARTKLLPRNLKED